MKVALVQMEVQERSCAANTEHGLRLLREAAAGHDVVVLPEIWTTGYSLGHLRSEAVTPEGDLFRRFGEIARENSCLLLPGSVPVRRDGVVYNSSPAFGRDGRLVHVYDKVHLFRMFHEDRFFGAGQDFDAYEAEGLKLGSTICYDLRFPELYRRMALQGAEIFVCAAEWPEARGAVWRLLLQARAAENHCFMLGVNAVGVNKNQRFFGHSMICGPDGRIIAEGSDREEIISAEIDVSEVAGLRSVLNALSDVRRELIDSGRK